MQRHYFLFVCSVYINASTPKLHIFADRTYVTEVDTRQMHIYAGNGPCIKLLALFLLLKLCHNANEFFGLAQLSPRIPGFDSVVELTSFFS